MIKFNATKKESLLIQRIVERDEKLLQLDRLEITMDLTAVHLNGCPLQLQEMLDGSDFDLVHDIDGIHNRLDRSTGKLTQCFLPRYSR